MIIHFYAFLCVASEDNALVSCRERVMRFFYMLRERITRFFYVAREDYPLFLIVAKNGSARFVRKIFARKKLLSGKF